MTKVQRIELEIEELSQSEFTELRDWMLERDWREWDAQIENDVRAGKLDDLLNEAQEAFRAGRSREL